VTKKLATVALFAYLTCPADPTPYAEIQNDPGQQKTKQ